MSFLSNRTQNDIGRALCVYAKGVIQKEVMEASLFSILFDEATDVSHVEKASFIVRYVYDMTMKEHFLKLCDVESTT